LEDQMKKTVLLLSSLVMVLLTTAGNCNGSAAVPCTTNADCDATALTPSCGASGFCEAADECSDNLDCQLANPASPTTDTENCTADTDCGGGERCLVGTNQNYCYGGANGDNIDCAGVANTTEVTAELASGGTTQVCLASGTCTEGSCG
jgi:hypothetical protein